MHFNTPAVICLMAARVAYAFPAPQETADEVLATLPTVGLTDPATSLDLLVELAKFASDASRKALESSNKQKRGLCTPFNLSIRREWYSIIASLSMQTD